MTQATSRQSNAAEQPPLSSLQASILHAISQDLASAQKLLDLLEDEQGAMESRNHQALTDIVQQKTDCLTVMEQQADCRYQILASLNRTIDEGEWKRLVAEQEHPQIQTAWQQLIDALETSQHLNEVNGRLIARGQQTLHHLLDLIRGQLNPPSLYNQRGTTESQQSGHSVTRA